MQRFAIGVLGSVLAVSGCQAPVEPSEWVQTVYGDVGPRADALLEGLHALVDDTDGRWPGTAGDRRARDWIAEQFTAAGLESEDGGYQQPFVDAQGRQTANVVGWVPGTDADLAQDVVFVVAHHDHLGPGFPGANDNASGVTAMVQIARDVADEPLSRTVMFIAFGSEESGFEGAEHFATTADWMDDGVFVVNLDMVGTLAQSGRIRAFGARAGSLADGWVSEAAAQWPARMARTGFTSRRSDNVSFCTRGIPYLFFWTRDPECYHGPCDNAERLDGDGLAATSLLIRDVVRRVASSPEDLRSRVEPGDDVCGKVID